jgi:hypothetical protein
MNLKELNSFKLSDAVTFHDKLNPKLWNGTKLRPDVREQLLIIAQDFLEELGVNDLDVKDITISGSNAAFSYTKHSDLDLHILVDMGNLPADEIYKELFTAKKTIYNDTHDIKIHTIPVELYVQDSRQPVVSLGEYSVMNDQWIKIPTKRRSNFDQTATKSKYEKLLSLIEIALQSKKYSKVKHIIDTIKRYRQAGLDKGGEFGPENLAYKMLRSQGYITKLYELRDKLHSEKLSFETMYQNIDEDEQFNNELWKPGLDFKQDINGILYHVTNAGKKNDFLSIKAYDKKNPNPIGDAQFAKARNLHTGEVQGVTSMKTRVDPKYQGQGIAANMYALIRMLGVNVLPSETQTTAGQKMWSKWRKQGDVNSLKNLDPKIKGVNEEEEEKNHWYDAGVRDAIRGARPNPRTYLPTLKDKQAKHPEEVYFYMNGYKSVKQQVDEAFDQPYPLKWESSDYGDVDALARLPDGSFLSIMFNQQQDDDGEAITQVEFYRNNSQEVTGEGDAQRIFATVLTAIQKYIKKHKPLRLTFSASKDNWAKQQQNSESRASLYDRLVQRYARAWGYRAFRADNGDLVIYELSRIQKQKAVKEELEQMPSVLYHATYKQRLKSIKLNGLGAGGKRNWTDSKKGVVYLALDPNVAESYAETALDDLDADWDIVILQVSTNGLDPSKFHLDSNVQDNEGDTVEYHGIIPPSNISLYKSGVAEEYNTMQFASEKTPAINPYGGRKDNQYRGSMSEASGYIPSEKEKNDPRFKTALTVDINPYTMKKGAKQFNWKISRAGIPPTAKTNGKV